MEILACFVSILQVSHTECYIYILGYFGCLVLLTVSKTPWFLFQEKHIILTLDVSAGLCSHLQKSFYFMSNFLFNWVESQNKFYKIVLELACRDRSLTISLVSQLGETSWPQLLCPSAIKALFKDNLCFLEDIIKIKKMLAETVKAKY